MKPISGSIVLAACLCLLLSGAAGAELTDVEELGKLLFFDTNLSTPPGQSCATCHDPETAFAGPISEINAHGAVYPGAVHVRFGNRKPPTAAYASFSPDFHYDEEEGLYVGGSFWDGRALNVVEQAKGPFLNRVEQNNPNMKVVINKIKHSDYGMFFQEVYGYGVFQDVEQAYQYMAEAIGAYEGSEEVNPFSSKYDAYLAGVVELTEQEMRGLVLFEGQAMCSACHPSQPAEDGTPPLFTDFTYDNLGVPKNPENPWYDMPPAFNPDGEDWVDLGLGGFLDDPAEYGKMKVPTLRNIGMRPYEGFVQAYTHNGFFKSLRDIVDFYNTRDVADWPPPEYPENVNDEELGDLGLSDQDVDDLVAFLNTLTDGWSEDGYFAQPIVPVSATAARLDLGSVYPNPFRTATQIEIRLQRPAAVAIAVHDLNGRLVRRLAGDGRLDAGIHRVIWDGTDDGGRTVPAGVYFTRITSPAGEEVERIHLIR